MSNIEVRSVKNPPRYSDFEILYFDFSFDGAYEGSVVAGGSMGDVMRVLPMSVAMPDSWEFLLHQLDGKNRIIFMDQKLKTALGKRKFGHRTIGVVYHSKYEQPENYVPSVMTERYDAFIYFDKAVALHSFHILPDGHQIPETFPFGV